MSAHYTDPRYRRARYACYLTNLTMAASANLPPLLFLTFRACYGISFTLLGLLVLLNFCTQLGMDLLFSFFSYRFDARRALRLMPALSFTGMVIFAVFPPLFPSAAYLPLVAGTLLFSAAGGLAEVLVNPVIAAIPTDDPAREISRLHSTYAWGTVLVVLLSTLFLALAGRDRWYILALLWAVVPLFSFFLFLTAHLPQIQSEQEKTKAGGSLSGGRLLCLFVACIFCGGAAECTMSQWCSGYLEAALGIPKLYGDIFGMALFALMLGMGRSLYSRRRTQIFPVLFSGMTAAFFLYLTAALSPLPILGLFACALTGLATSMLWPGSLLLLGEKSPRTGIAVYALMAAGGDCGAAVAPQLVGLLADKVAAAPFAASLAGRLSIPVGQLALKAGMLSASLFPLAGVLVLFLLRRKLKKSDPLRTSPLQGK